MNYTQLNLSFSDPIYVEILESELAEIGFDSFEVKGTTLLAYIPQHDFNSLAVTMVLDNYRDVIHSAEQSSIAHQNWNVEWESSYEPVMIDDTIYIRASFHPERTDAKYSIILEPNMSFGTGHHPTTAMMLRALSRLDLEGKALCDFGAGSGILAIYAGMRGARGLAIEIDPQAAEAAAINLKNNHITAFEMAVGDKALVKDHTFDVIAANINRNAIEEALPILQDALNPGGKLLCAGFLDADAEDLKSVLATHGLTTTSVQSQDGWTQITAQRS